MPGADLTFAASAAPPADWTRALTGEQAFADPAWLALFAGRAPDERCWLTVRRAGAIAAGVAGHLQRAPLDYVLLDPALIDPARSPLWPAARPAAAPSPLDLPWLWLVYPGLASFVIGGAEVDTLIAGAIAWAWQAGARAVVWPYVGAADAALAAALAAAGFAAIPITAEAWLPVPPTGWAGYLDALPAGQRRDVRRERRRLADAGTATRIGGADDLARCAELRCAQQHKYGRPADVAHERARLVTLGELAESCLVIVDSTARRRTTPVSFCWFSRLGADWHAMSTGTDYDDPAGRFAYFEACFYGALDAAAQAGARRIGYGHAATLAKRRRGCDIQPVTAWALARAPAAQRALVELAAQWAAAA